MRDSDEQELLRVSPPGSVVRWFSVTSESESKLVQAVKNGRVDMGEDWIAAGHNGICLITYWIAST